MFKQAATLHIQGRNMIRTRDKEEIEPKKTEINFKVVFSHRMNPLTVCIRQITVDWSRAPLQDGWIENK